MATASQNLSNYDPTLVPDASEIRFGIVVSQWNTEITSSLSRAAESTLLKHGAKKENIFYAHVPGSFELPLSAQWLIEFKEVDAVICIGSIIQGETRHFDFVCNAVAQGIKDASLKYNTPVIFCVLTDNTLQQAKDRSGGKHGNKGIESAIAAIKMVDIRKSLSSE